MARTAVHVRELTAREREILLLTADGRSAPDIALHLDLSPSAVKLVLLSSFEKLGVNDRAARGRGRPRQRSPRLARQRADDLLPPRPLGGSGGAGEPPSRHALELPRGSDGQQRAGDREAAVGERDERARLVAARAQLVDDLEAQDGRAAATGCRRTSCHGRTLVTAGRLSTRGRGRLCASSGPVRHVRMTSWNSTATSWRTIMCSWSPDSMIVEPRGGIARSPRTITLSSASRGRPSSRTGWPTTASVSRTGNCTTSAPSRLSSTGSTSGAGIAASSLVTPSSRATGSIVVPCSIVDSSTTKKATLKIRCPCGSPSVTGNVANTIGVAPRRPAQPSIIARAARSRLSAVTITAATGRATAAVMIAIAIDCHAYVVELVREHEQPEREEEPELRDPGQAVVECDDRAPAGVDAVPSTRPAR